MSEFPDSYASWAAQPDVRDLQAVLHEKLVTEEERQRRQKFFDLVQGAVTPVGGAGFFGRQMQRNPNQTRADMQADIQAALEGKNTRGEQRNAIDAILRRYGVRDKISAEQVETILDQAGAPDVEQERINAYVTLAQKHEAGEMDDDAYARALSLLLP